MLSKMSDSTKFSGTEVFGLWSILTVEKDLNHFKGKY